MSKYFNEGEIEIIRQCYVEVDEVFCDIRKTIPQTKYVIEIVRKGVWDGTSMTTVPEDLVGYWMQPYGFDNTRTNCSSRIGIDDRYNEQCEWVRCECIPETTYTYKEI